MTVDSADGEGHPDRTGLTSLTISHCRLGAQLQQRAVDHTFILGCACCGDLRIVYIVDPGTGGNCTDGIAVVRFFGIHRAVFVVQLHLAGKYAVQGDSAVISDGNRCCLCAGLAGNLAAQQHGALHKCAGGDIAAGITECGISTDHQVCIASACRCTAGNLAAVHVESTAGSA